MTGPSEQRLLFRALRRQTLDWPLIWLLRWAGRYLSQCRVLRAKAADFSGFCVNTETALQSIRRLADGAGSVSAGRTLKQARAGLNRQKALIGVAGGPWTVAAYMTEGRVGERSKARTFDYQHPGEVDARLVIPAGATARYRVMPPGSAAQTLKQFGSWTQHLRIDLFERVVTGPHKRTVEAAVVDQISRWRRR